MKIVYHPNYNTVYASDPAAEAGRMEAIFMELQGKYDFLEPEPASEDDLKRVHTQSHIDLIERNPNRYENPYEIGCLAAGGAILAAELGMKGESSFGLIRPPGHHASSDHCWGFCFFNNIAVALAKLQAENRIQKALILDFDLHFGDGTDNIFAGSKIKYFQPPTRDRKGFIEEINKKFQVEREYDILAVSAGFDRHVEDWGGLLTTEDYRIIGQAVKEAAQKICQGRRFAVLEGGYNHKVLGKNVKAFLEGLE
jgi:acetoin utilization deacetylase AcuC-like enzyme